MWPPGADGYFEADLKPWDVAAGLLLCEEAGAKISDYGGGGHTPFRPRNFVAPPLLADQILKYL